MMWIGETIRFQELVSFLRDSIIAFGCRDEFWYHWNVQLQKEFTRNYHKKTETILFHCFSPWTHRTWLAAGAQIDDWSTRHVKSMVGLLRKITHPRLSAICTVFQYLRDIPWCNCSQYSMPGDPKQLLHGHCIILICHIIYVWNGIDMAINLNTIVWPYLADCVTKCVWKSF